MYGCETWSLALREEHILRVLQNRLLPEIFGPKREWRKLHNEEFYGLYSLTDINRVIKSRKLRWARHVACMGVRMGAYRILMGRPQGKNPLGRPGHRYEENIKINLQELGLGGGGWIGLE